MWNKMPKPTIFEISFLWKSVFVFITEIIWQTFDVQQSIFDRVEGLDLLDFISIFQQCTHAKELWFKHEQILPAHGSKAKPIQERCQDLKKNNCRKNNFIHDFQRVWGFFFLWLTLDLLSLSRCHWKVIKWHIFSFKMSIERVMALFL